MQRQMLMKLFLIQKKITQRRLALRADIHYARVNNYLNGILVIGMQQERKLCRALKIDPEAFFQGEIVEIKK